MEYNRIYYNFNYILSSCQEHNIILKVVCAIRLFINNLKVQIDKIMQKGYYIFNRLNRYTKWKGRFRTKLIVFGVKLLEKVKWISDNVNISKGIGSISLDGKDLKDEEKIGTGSSLVKIDGGVGSIEIKMKEE